MREPPVLGCSLKSGSEANEAPPARMIHVTQKISRVRMYRCHTSGGGGGGVDTLAEPCGCRFWWEGGQHHPGTID